MILVKIARIGAPVKEVSLNDSSTVADALMAAGESSSGATLKVGGNTVNEDTVLHNSDVIAIVENVKNGR